MDDNKKRENFKRIAERRTNEILAKISSFKNFANNSFYIYDNDDIEKITRAIVQEIKNSIAPLIKENK